MRLALYASLIVVALSSGCATYTPTARAAVACDGTECDVLWQRAQIWLATHSRYRLQLVTDAVLQTYGPLESSSDAIAYTVTREKQSDGKTLIVIRGTCYATAYGCMFDPSAQTNALYFELANQATP